MQEEKFARTKPQFKPLIMGGILASALAIRSTWASYDYQMLFGPLAILISYIIPAHLLRRRNKNVHH